MTAVVKKKKKNRIINSTNIHFGCHVSTNFYERLTENESEVT